MNEANEVDGVVMRREWFNQSEYPADFVPNDGAVFVGVDRAKDGSTCTAKGFYKDGVYHVQSVEHRGA